MVRTKVSVIVPFFNEGNMIAECLDSIRTQTLSDIEIICVDNHACPDTRACVERIATADRRLIVVNCKARGSGPARNKGVLVARSKYIAFVDADDLLFNRFSFQLLYEAAEATSAELARGNVYVSSSPEEPYCILETLGQRIWFSRQALTTYTNEPLLWLPVQHQAYLFNRSFLARNKLLYPNLLRGQDQPFLLNVLLSGANVIVTDHPTYVYRKGHRAHDSLVEPCNYLDRMISIRMIKTALLERKLEAQWHLVFARMAIYMERVINGSSEIRTDRIMDVIHDIVYGLERFGTLDYRPYSLGVVGQRLLKHALQEGWTNAHRNIANRVYI